MTRERTTDTHPSFGVVRINRIHGNARLFNSAVTHQHFISIQIAHATRDRDLHEDWIHGGRKIVEVYLSEAQFAHAITSIGMGDGSPCTISSVDGQRVDEPPTEAMRDTFDREIVVELRDLAATTRQLKDDLDTLLAQPRLSKEDKERLKGLAFKVEQDVRANLPFIQHQFDEAMEKAVQHAKIEVEAHVNAVIRSQGLVALREGFPQLTVADENES